MQKIFRFRLKKNDFDIKKIFLFEIHQKLSFKHIFINFLPEHFLFQDQNSM